MNYNETILLEIQFAYTILGIVTATFIGSVGCGIWLFLSKGAAKFYIKDAMKFLKIILASFVLPVIPFMLYPLLKNLGVVGGTYMVQGMIDILMIVTQIWVIAVVVVLAIRMVNYVIVCKICKDNIPVEDSVVLEELERWRQVLNIRKRVTLFVNSNMSSPAIMYHRGYQILLPAYEMTQKEMSMAILHELVHLEHNDLWVKRISAFVGAIHAVNPLAKVIKGQVARWAEVLCDLTTCEVGKENFSRQEYYYSIMHMMSNAELRMTNDIMFALYKDKSLLEFRVEMFAQANEKKQLCFRRAICFMAIFMVLATATMLGVTVQATSIWFEESLTNHAEERGVETDWKEMSHDEMFQETNIIWGELEYGEETEQTYTLNAGEMICFRIQKEDSQQGVVHIFSEGESYILGSTDGDMVTYRYGSDVTFEVLEYACETEGIFVKNIGEDKIKIEVVGIGN